MPLILSLALFSFLLFVQCGRHKDPITIQVSVNSGTNSRAEIINPLDGSGVLNVVWSEGDVLHVFSSTGDGYLGHLALVNGAGSNQAIFRGTLKPFTRQLLHFYYLGKNGNALGEEQLSSGSYSISLEHQRNYTLDDIENSLHLAYGTQTISPHEGEVTPDFPLQMNSKIAICLFNTSALYGDVKLDGPNIYSKLNVDLNNGLFTNEDPRSLHLGTPSETVYFAMAPADNITLSFSGATAGSYSYPTRNIEAGKFYSTHGSAVNPPSVVAHAFSVSDTKQVRFTMGNLVYSRGRWYVHDRQHSTIATMAQPYISPSPGPNATFDYFPWGGTGYGVTTPWFTTNPNNYGGGANSIAGTEYDWGVYLTGDNTAERGVYTSSTSNDKLQGLWRTLTHLEWQYLLTRERDGRLMSWMGKLQTREGGMVLGVFIMPDAYDGFLPTDVNINGTSTNPHVMTEAELFISGGVFLPAMGYLAENSTGRVIGYGQEMRMWSTERANSATVYFVAFGLPKSNVAYPVQPPYDSNNGETTKPGCRLPVRLAQDIN